jgi:hypothetical protein
VRGDLLGPEAEIPKALKEADFYDFDVIVMSMALHRLEDPQLMTVKLVESRQVNKPVSQPSAKVF